MEQTKYDVNYFFQKFRNIPSRKWITDVLDDGDKHCAFGFCGGFSTEEAESLCLIFYKYFYQKIDIRLGQTRTLIVAINDGCYRGFGISIPGESPKERIMYVITRARIKEMQKAAVIGARRIIKSPKPTLCIQKNSLAATKT